MCNIVSGSEYSNKWRLTQSCCGCSLRVGSLIIGWLDLLAGILWIISAFTGSGSGRPGNYESHYIGIGNVILTILAALCILVGVYKGLVNILWVSVYFHLIIVIWCLIVIIIFFVYLLFVPAVVGIIQLIVTVYLFLVLRSYAFELDGGLPAGSPA
ncbi:UNVERIFIED_CONTAM: hypothetical protein RMT77_005445 [Armadillidium vulgare]